MQSHELLKDVLKRTSAKQIAADMNLSLSLIYKWAEPPGEVAGNQTVVTSVRDGCSAHVPLAGVMRLVSTNVKVADPTA